MKTPRIERRPVVNVGADWPESVHPVLRRVYAARGISRPHEIEHRLASLHAPNLLGGIGRACELIEDAIENDHRIVIVGDFDADGATGTAVAVRGLRMLGARNVDYSVPNRFTHGYGLSVALVNDLKPLDPKLLITVDNGIVAHAGVREARTRGMRRCSFRTVPAPTARKRRRQSPSPTRIA
jgi:single-stranded-DNA-specific exonuclease